MDQAKLEAVAKRLVQQGSGLLAADESTPSCTKRFEAVGLESTPETRRAYRQILITTKQEILSGVILYDETFWQRTDAGQPFVEYLQDQDVLPGIKVDLGLIDLPGFPGEKITQGLDGLPERMAKYAAHGATFAKWRDVIAIGDGIPTDECIGINALILARYARICQDAGIVPIVEPEVLFDGNHTSEQCEQVMTRLFDVLFATMKQFRVHLPGAILKTSMVLPGKESGMQIDHAEVADRTCRVLYHHVPHELGGIVFLSGGQTPKDAFINLNRIVQRGPFPWSLTFSFSRALQDPVLKAWAKDQHDVDSAQHIFKKQLQYAHEASAGTLDESSLGDDPFVSRSQD